MDKWQHSIDKQIRRAQQDGKFENLPGHGKPLDLQENPFEDPVTRMAHRLLRDNGFSLPWIEEGKQIDALFESAREALEGTWKWYCQKIGTDAEAWAKKEWARAVVVFKQQIDRINERILNYNVQVPSDHFGRLKIDAVRAIQEIQSAKE